jgi:hypothetical protein
MPVYVPIPLNLVILQTQKPPARPFLQIPFQQANLQPNPLPPWFEKLDFDALLSFSVNPPLLPNIKNDLDVSNFDTEFTQSEVDSFGEKTESGEVEECYSGFGFGRRGGSVDGRRREGALN